MNITIIGSGNVAWHLAPELENSGHKIESVYSRITSNAKALTARLYDATIASSLDFSNSKSLLFVIAVADDAIEEIAKELVLPEEAIVVHTSGSKPLSILGYLPTDDIGVFYPLQTFSKSKRLNFSEIPILIEAETKQTSKLLFSMAKSISKNVKEVNSLDRKALHVSAVFACNFTNHMFTIAKTLMDEKDLDFNLLKPLITETINKSLALGPNNAQTGPAKRHDVDLLENHMQYLSEHEDYAAIYQQISQQIIDSYPEK